MEKFDFGKIVLRAIVIGMTCERGTMQCFQRCRWTICDVVEGVV